MKKEKDERRSNLLGGGGRRGGQQQVVFGTEWAFALFVVSKLELEVQGELVVG